MVPFILSQLLLLATNAACQSTFWPLKASVKWIADLLTLLLAWFLQLQKGRTSCLMYKDHANKRAPSFTAVSSDPINSLVLLQLKKPHRDCFFLSVIV